MVSFWRHRFSPKRPSDLAVYSPRAADWFLASFVSHPLLCHDHRGRIFICWNDVALHGKREPLAPCIPIPYALLSRGITAMSATLMRSDGRLTGTPCLNIYLLNRPWQLGYRGFYAVASSYLNRNVTGSLGFTEDSKLILYVMLQVSLTAS